MLFCFVQEFYSKMGRISPHVLSWLSCAVLACFGAEAQAGRTLLQSTCAYPELPDVNLTAYTGVWYQIASTANSQTDMTTAICTSGRYSLITSGSNADAIRVRWDSYNTSSGEYTSTVGLLTVTGRALSLQVPGFSASDYRIIYLKSSSDHKYKTAMTYSCSNLDRGMVYAQGVTILSRKPTLESGSVAELVAYAQSLGIMFEGENQVVMTPQDAITCGRNYG